ncbi:CHASE3 domain-containing protein [Archangium violaceum]|uniref:CHASE3 domain-containing protein n=1 Tax=Archangium violaceum TaxID=83451 RepID=UPI0019525871|nr:CHASE3 domain-containing protein [Archangium violaceum]QRN99618.1 CHASE3 domain-containing protein [Archangium violaceum]
MASNPPRPHTPRRSHRFPLLVLAGHLAASLAVLLIAGLFLRSTHQLSRTSGRVTHTLDVISEADHLLSLLKDAETGQRGYLLTGEELFLAPYEEALLHIRPSKERLRSLLSEDDSQRQRLERMDALIQRKLEVMEQTISLSRGGQPAEAAEQVRAGEGKRLMDELRVLERELREEEQRRLEEQNAQLGQASERADVIVLSGSSFLLGFIGFAALSFMRDWRARERAEAEREELLAREQALRVQEEAERQRIRLQSILTQVPAAVGVYRASDQVCELANPALEKLHGRPLLGRAVWEAFPEQKGSPLHDIFNDVFRTGQPFTTTGMRVMLDRDNDGRFTEGYFNLTYQPLKDAGGQLEAVLLFAVEVTEQVHARQAAEAALAELERAEQLQGQSEARFRLLAETLPQLIWMSRADGYTEYFNPRWYEYTGQKPGQALGDGWSQALHPEDVVHSLETWKRAVTTGEPYGIEYRLRRADGAYRWFIARGLPLRDSEGHITQWFGTCTDIDEQTRGAESLLFLSEASAALAASLDHAATLQQVARLTVPSLADWCLVDLKGEDGRIERVEVTHADHTLAPLAEQLRRFPPTGNEHPSARAMHSGRTVHLPEMTRELVERAAYNAEHLRLTLEEMRPRSLVAAPLLARGRTLGVLTFVTSETSGRRYEEEDVLLLEEVARRAAMALDNARLFSLAQEERKHAEEANRLKDDFLATVSHELRTPLTAMLGWVKMLRSGRLAPDKHARALETVDRNAQAQAQLIEDLLDVSRIITGKLRLETRPVHLAEVVQAAMESVRPAADAKDIRFQPELSETEDLVMGDPGRLQQVVWNLLSNAVKFSPGGSRVRVLLRRVDSSVEVTVADEGPGVPEDFLPHIFERFRQLEGGTTRRHGGLGLGLAIVRHLVELHGGTVHAASEGLGRGASFTVRLPPILPRQTAPDSAAPRKSMALPSVRQPLHPVLAKRRILVVDDEEDNREVLKMMLEEYGAHVLTAASAAEALRAVREHRPELLVSDIGMPGEDGYQLITQVRALPVEEGGGVPAVALTAYARVEDRARALTVGFNMHVAKPVEPSELLTLLSNLMSLSPTG